MFKKICEHNLKKKIYEIILENIFMTISWKFAIIQSFCYNPGFFNI